MILLKSDFSALFTCTYPAFFSMIYILTGGETRARPHRTANFAVQTADICLCGGAGRGWRAGDNVVQNVSVKPAPGVLFDNTKSQ